MKTEVTAPYKRVYQKVFLFFFLFFFSPVKHIRGLVKEEYLGIIVG